MTHVTNEYLLKIIHESIAEILELIKQKISHLNDNTQSSLITSIAVTFLAYVLDSSTENYSKIAREEIINHAIQSLKNFFEIVRVDHV